MAGNEKHKQAKSVVIYSEDNNKYIRDDIKRLFGKYDAVKYMYGDFEKVLEKIPQDSSFMLSDFNKVVTMADAGRLNYASLILPYDYEYNFVINEEGKRVPIVDMTYLGKDNLFKVAYFNACL